VSESPAYRSHPPTAPARLLRHRFPGGRVGFLTFPCEPDSDVARALESKAKMLLRAQVGSPATMAQVVLLRALQARVEGI
jgi:hypothetical protein